ncbi:MAG: hypothetical protein ABI600_10515 [Luteolibacter sp.]
MTRKPGKIGKLMAFSRWNHGLQTDKSIQALIKGFRDLHRSGANHRRDLVIGGNEVQRRLGNWLFSQKKRRNPFEIRRY